MPVFWPVGEISQAFFMSKFDCTQFAKKTCPVMKQIFKPYFEQKQLTARNVQFYGDKEVKCMQEITLREVCDKYEVSRRAVQGYEKAGMVKATGKNKMGYLLYDAAAQERIGTIRMYQKIGFSIKEIKEIIDAPRIDIIPILENQMKKLEKERQKIEEQIEILYALIQEK